MKDQTLSTRIALANRAVDTFDTKLAQLTDVARAATQQFADDPSEANAKKVRTARSELDDWKLGRDVALANLQALREEEVSEEIKAHAERARDAVQRASRRQFRAAIGPHVDQIVSHAKAIEQSVIACEQIIGAQRRAANEAVESASLAGIDCKVDSLELGDLACEVLLAMHRSGIARPLAALFARFPDDCALAQRIMELTGNGGVYHGIGASFLEQAEAALNGEMETIVAPLRAEHVRQAEADAAAAE